jgi:hypothetical protein
MSGKEASSNAGQCPFKGQLSGLRSRSRARNQFLSLSLSTTRTTPHFQMLLNHPAFYLPFRVLPRGPHGRLRSYKFPNKTVSCELVGHFISLLQHVHGPNTVPLCAGWRYHSTPFGTAVPVDTLF